MGYTHYWKLPEIDKETWAKIQAASEEVVAEVPNLQFEFNAVGPPLINEGAIRFNGKGEDGHETFFLERADCEFNFCKTARKPYDEAVTAVLCIVGHHLTKAGALKDPYYISSDGYFSDWTGRELATKALGEDLAFALED
jgi:hypothetical protein